VGIKLKIASLIVAAQWENEDYCFSIIIGHAPQMRPS